MPKVDMDYVSVAIRRADVDDKNHQRIIEELNRILMEEVEEEKKPQVKKQFCILLSDPEGELEGKDMVGWVLQIPEETSPATLQDSVKKAIYDFNQSPRGRRMPVKTFGEGFEIATAKFFKEQEVWVKTKEPVLVLTTDNNSILDEG